MLTGLYQSAAILGVAVAFYITDAAFIARYDKRRQETGRSWTYTLVMLAAAALLIAQPTLLPWLGLQVDTFWGLAIQIAGGLLVLGGLGLHGWSRAHLRQFYAEDAKLEPDHYVVDTGPYAYVRHPMFTSYFLLAIGLVLVNPAVPAVLMAVYAFWDFSQAAKRDEALLRDEVPGYADYMSRTTRRFMPRVSDIIRRR